MIKKNRRILTFSLICGFVLSVVMLLFLNTSWFTVIAGEQTGNNVNATIEYSGQQTEGYSFLSYSTLEGKYWVMDSGLSTKVITNGTNDNVFGNNVGDTQAGGGYRTSLTITIKVNVTCPSDFAKLVLYGNFNVNSKANINVYHNVTLPENSGLTQQENYDNVNLASGDKVVFDSNFMARQIPIYFLKGTNTITISMVNINEQGYQGWFEGFSFTPTNESLMQNLNPDGYGGTVLDYNTDPVDIDFIGASDQKNLTFQKYAGLTGSAFVFTNESALGKNIDDNVDNPFSIKISIDNVLSQQRQVRLTLNINYLDIKTIKSSQLITETNSVVTSLTPTGITGGIYFDLTLDSASDYNFVISMGLESSNNYAGWFETFSLEYIDDTIDFDALTKGSDGYASIINNFATTNNISVFKDEIGYNNTSEITARQNGSTENGYIEFKIDVDKADNYLIRIKPRSWTDAPLRRMQIIVNGTTLQYYNGGDVLQPFYQLNFNTNWGYGTGEQTELKIPLNSGSNTVRFSTYITADNLTNNWWLDQIQIALIHDVSVDGVVTKVIDGESYTLPSETPDGFMTYVVNGTSFCDPATTFTPTGNLDIKSVCLKIECLGAQVRLEEGYGIRFVFEVDTTSFNNLKNGIAVAGVTISDFGGVIVPEQVLNNDAYDKLYISTIKTMENGDKTRYHSTLDYVDQNGSFDARRYSVNLTAQGYVVLKLENGQEKTCYSGMQTRSMVEIANLALELSDEQSSEFKYEITVDDITKWSKYNTVHRERLEEIVALATQGN